MIDVEQHRVTLAQAGVWFADQLLEHTSAYLVTVRILVEGCDRKTIERGCAQLVETTPALRLRIGISDAGDVVQWFDPAPVPVEWIDAQDMDDDAIEAVLKEAISRPMTTDGGQLTRLVAVGLPSSQVIVAVVAHHSIIDGTSQAIVASRFYDCLRGTVTAQSPAVYLDAVRWVMTAEDRARVADLPYWIARITGDLDLTSQRPSQSPPATGGNVRGLLPARWVAGLRRIADEQEVSLFFVLLAAIHGTLAHCGVGPTALGAAASIRPPGETYRDVVGCFVNQVPLIALPVTGESFASGLLRQAPLWRRDLARRFMPLSVLSDALRDRTGMRPSLDTFRVSYRSPQARRSWRHGPLLVTADIFPKYYRPKTEFCIRLMHLSQQLQYDIEWAPYDHPELGSDYEKIFRDFVEGAAR